MKVLFFGMLVSSPALAVWIFRSSDSAPTPPQILPISNTASPDSIVRVPVEVIATGSAPEVVYIEVASQALPKPARQTTRAEFRKDTLLKVHAPIQAR